MKKIKIAIADDHKIFMEGLAMLLNSFENFEVVFTASNGIEFLDQLKKRSIDPNVILMDIQMPEMNGFETTKEVLKILPDCKILFLSSHKGIQYTIKAIQSHAHGYLLKNTDARTLKQAIIKVVEDGFYFSENFSLEKFKEIKNADGFAPENSPHEINFSDKEIEMMKLICNQMTDAEIAKALGLSEETTKTYRKRLMKKTNAKKTIGIVVYALKNEIF